MASGVYKITNTANGKFYIGSARHIGERQRKHRQDLRRGKHHSPYLQASWNKYGAEAFVFSTMLFCSPEDLIFFEQRCIDAYNPDYNLMRVGDVGWTHSESTKEKIRASAKAQHKDPKYLAKRELYLEAKAALRFADEVLHPKPQKPKGEPIPARVITHDGKSLTYRGWAEELGITKKQVEKRLSMHRDDLARALSPTKPPEEKLYTAHGETRTLTKWSELLGIPRGTLVSRIHQCKMPLEVALTNKKFTSYTRMTDEQKARMKASGADRLKRATTTNQHRVTFQGETLTYAEWGARVGVSAQVIYTRLKVNGWDVERALTTPRIDGPDPKLYEFRGAQVSAAELASQLGLNVKNVRERLRAGASPEDIADGRKRRRFEFMGETKTSEEWAEKFGVTPSYVSAMVKKLGEHEGLARLHDRGPAAAKARPVPKPMRVPLPGDPGTDFCLDLGPEFETGLFA